jgi:hypothetical protein
MPVLMQEKSGFYQNRSIKDKLLKKKWSAAIPVWQEWVNQI